MQQQLEDYQLQPGGRFVCVIPAWRGVALSELQLVVLKLHLYIIMAM
jgi:hypothetical protein